MFNITNNFIKLNRRNAYEQTESPYRIPEGKDRLVHRRVIGLGVFLLSIYLAFSRYGSIRLGGPNEKPKYSDFAWSSMMFTAGLAADILFYSFCEWILYANDPHIAEMGSMQIWSSNAPCR